MARPPAFLDGVWRPCPANFTSLVEAKRYSGDVPLSLVEAIHGVLDEVQIYDRALRTRDGFGEQRGSLAFCRARGCGLLPRPIVNEKPTRGRGDAHTLPCRRSTVPKRTRRRLSWLCSDPTARIEPMVEKAGMQRERAKAVCQREKHARVSTGCGRASNAATGPING